LEERHDGNSRLEPQEPESELGGGKACALAIGAGYKRRQRDWRRRQRDDKGRDDHGVDVEALMKGGVAACKGRELEDGSKRLAPCGRRAAFGSLISTIVAGLGRRERGTVSLKRGGSRRDSGFCGNAAAGVLVMRIIVCELVCGGNARERKLMRSNEGLGGNAEVM
jgi:hypothetical protein